MSCGWMGLRYKVRGIGDFVVLEVSVVEKLWRGCVLGRRGEPLVVLKQGHAVCRGGVKLFGKTVLYMLLNRNDKRTFDL